MHTLPDTSKWHDRIWASFIFFTRLPFWRIYEPPQQAYRAVVEHWALTGWFTGGLMALTYWLSSQFFPATVALILAMGIRMLATGALHEDGLADFFDGFGGGRSRPRILEIMKDSHIGTFGVLGLVFYVLLLFLTLLSLPHEMIAMTILAADPFSKMVTTQLTQILPYARNELHAKSGMVYRRMGLWSGLLVLAQGLLPLLLFFSILENGEYWTTFVFVPCLVMYALLFFIRSRIQGYTGDCCGAVVLLVELSFYACASWIYGG